MITIIMILIQIRPSHHQQVVWLSDGLIEMSQVKIKPARAARSVHSFQLETEVTGGLKEEFLERKIMIPSVVKKFLVVQ
jgi:hypothetical protein